jgi:hypothetical protein
LTPLLLPLLAALSGLAAATAGAAEIGLDAAAKHVGESATVCGVVESARYAERSPSQPTFLNLGRAYPNQLFTVVIFGVDRVKFGTPESALLKKRVCATGVVKLFQGRPEMNLSDPAKLTPAR